MIKEWLQKFFKGVIEVTVVVDAKDQYNQIISLTREHEQAKVLLSQFHEAYRECMSRVDFVNSYSAPFYLVAKETAKMLDTPLWRNMTPPGGMPGSGSEPMMERQKQITNRR